MLTRYVINQVASIAVGPLQELAPDLTIVTAPNADGIVEKDSIEVQGLLFVDVDSLVGVIIVLPPEIKQQLVKALTGGVEIATKLPSSLDAIVKT